MLKKGAGKEQDKQSRLYNGLIKRNERDVISLL